MKIYLSLLAVLILTASAAFAQNISPDRLYEQQRGTQSPPDGVWHVYDSRGNLLREENYQNYRLEGPLKIFYPSGALKELVHYSDGIREGDDRAYFESGGLEHESNYHNNDLEGDGIHLYDTGEIKSREHYSEGRLSGRKTIYYKNGYLKQSMNYHRGLLDGPVDTYAQDGSVITEEHYEHGNLISHYEYGKKAAFDSKSDEGSKETYPPVPNNSPAPADMPTKLDSYGHS